MKHCIQQHSLFAAALAASWTLASCDQSPVDEVGDPDPTQPSSAALDEAITAASKLRPPKRGLPEGLRPGEPVELEQTVPINLVFIGFEPDDIDPTAVLTELPETYVPRARIPADYGGEQRPLGVSFEFDYETYFADQALEDEFFGFLHGIGRPGARTVYQTYYNDQQTNVVDVAEEVLHIDGPATEAWLQSHLSAMVPNQRTQGYTVYFVNWYGREDFRFHVYESVDQPEPDTGVPFGSDDSRKMIAWGGSVSRSWFFDPSAGPELWSGNFYVDGEDFDGDGYGDYRIPPVWEYAENGFKTPGELATDLGYVTRFVAINLLFTPSPLYDPMVTAPEPGGRKLVQFEMLEDDEASAAQGLDLFNPGLVAERMRSFQPYHDWDIEVSVTDPIDAAAQQSFRIFAGLDASEGCWTAFGDPFAQLTCFFQANAGNYFGEPREGDYVAPVIGFNTTDANLGSLAGLLGFADSNLVDGTQQFTYAFATPDSIAGGYGFTATTVHELGHHFGLSHPHDGYDFEYDFDYGALASTYFAWLGDESESVMHYLSTSVDFGVFNRDSTHRYETAGYLQFATDALGRIEAAPLDGDAAFWVPLMVQAAQISAGIARERYDRFYYDQAVGAARVAYTLLRIVEIQLGLEPPTVQLAVEPRQHDPMFCEVRYPGL